MSGSLLVFTGAGLSADSGLATFRDSGGLWEGVDPALVASASTWRANRELVHRFYDERRAQCARAAPNAGHAMLVEWQRRLGARLITQNVDDLLERAGATDVLKVHGDLSEMACVSCGRRWTVSGAWPADGRCACGSLRGVRPGIVMFGDEPPLYRPMREAFAALGRGDLLVVIGTGGEVVDVGRVAERTRATTVLSNLASAEEEPMPGMCRAMDRQFDHVAHGRLADTWRDLDALVTRLMS